MLVYQRVFDILCLFEHGVCLPRKWHVLDRGKDETPIRIVRLCPIYDVWVPHLMSPIQHCLFFAHQDSYRVESCLKLKPHIISTLDCTELWLHITHILVSAVCKTRVANYPRIRFVGYIPGF